MPVPSSIADLSTSPASNSPAGSETPSSTDDYLRTHAAFIKQLAEGNASWCGTAGGTANALTLTPSPAITAYAAGQVFRFKAASTNTGATTIAISGLTTVAAQVNGAACAGGEIVSGQWYEAWLSDTSTAQVRACAAPNQVGAINFKRATVAATATTTPLWATANGNIQDWTGTPTITDFPAAPQAGAQREVYPAAGTIITNAGNISVQGNANYTVAAGDKLVVTAITTTTFYVSVVRKDGLATVTNGEYRSVQVFTASGTYTKPAGLKRVKVIVTAGGASGAVNPGTFGGIGGGAGGTAIKTIEATALAASETVTVGAGGASSNGGASSFGSHCSAAGGGGTGNGGTATGGDINIIGGGGGTGSASTGGSSIPGNGGSSYWGGGRSTNIYAGAGGPAAFGSGGAGNGATGQGGIVTVEEFF